MGFSVQSLKPVWSSQHGATVTLGVCWGIPVLISDSLSGAQLLTLVFLLSGFMFMELFGGRVTRGRWKDHQKAVWGYIYLAIMLLSGIFVFLWNASFLFLFLFLLIGGISYSVLLLQKKERELYAQLLAFSLFAMAGLLAFPSDFSITRSEVLRLWVVEVLYFGISPFTLKLRLGVIGKGPVVYYLLFALLLLVLFLPASNLLYVVSVFFGVKVLFPVLATETFMAMKIKKIGLMELVYALIFLTLVPVFF